MILQTAPPFEKPIFAEGNWRLGILLMPILLINGIATGADEFSKRVRPFFDSYCVTCHGPQDPKGELSLHDLSEFARGEEALGRWESILERLESGEMPPTDAKQPKDGTRKAIIHLIDSSQNVRVFDQLTTAKGFFPVL